MNFRIKQALLAAGIASTMGLPMTSQASDGTISFTGAVTASTCVVTVNGAGTGNAYNVSPNGSSAAADATVSLPTVSVSSLSNGNSAAAVNSTSTPGTSAGTFFNMKVSGCSTVADIGSSPAKPTTVQIYFEAGPNVDTNTYGLVNTTSGGSTVEVNLYKAFGGSNVGNQIEPGVQEAAHQPDPITIIGGADSTNSTTQWFYAGYSTAAITAGTAPTAGAVTTSVTYSLVYQ